LVHQGDGFPQVFLGFADNPAEFRSLWIELTFYLTLDLHVVQVTLEVLLYRHVVRGVPDQDPPLG
jgi:hypothetical protein